jgi:protein TonB
MDFEAWSLRETDPGRARRLAIGYATGVAVCLVVAIAGAMVKGKAPVAEEEDVIDVKLASRTAEAPPPPPPPPPPIEVRRGPPAPRGNRPLLTAPKEVPTELPPEGPPTNARGSGEGDYGEDRGEPGGVPGGTGTAPAAAPPPPPPPPPPAPPPPKPEGPIQLPEDATPPEAISKADPSFSDAVRSAGIETTVAVKYVVTETGAVTNVTIVRGGHPMVNDTILAAVRSWRFRPAKLPNGMTIAVFRIAKFRIKPKA